MSESLSLSTLFLSFVLMLFCFSTAKGHRSRQLLGVFFGLIAVHSFFKYVAFSGELLHQLPALLIVPELTGVITPAVIYLYVLELLGRKPSSRMYAAMLVLPLVLIVMFTSFFILTSGFTVEVFYVYECFIGFAFLTSLSYIIYLILAFRAIRRTLQNQPDALAPHVQVVLFWVRWLLGLLMFRAVMALIFIPIQLFYGRDEWIQTLLDPYRLIVAIAMLLATGLTAYYALRNPALFDSIQGTVSFEQKLAIAIVPAAHKEVLTKGVSVEEIQTFVKRLITIVESDQLYLNSRLTTKWISEKSGIPVYKITLALNRGMGKNFSEFINTYRIDYAKRILADPANDRLTMVAIAEAAGFASVAPFYASFRKKTGLSPADFRSQTRAAVS